MLTASLYMLDSCQVYTRLLQRLEWSALCLGVGLEPMLAWPAWRPGLVAPLSVRLGDADLVSSPPPQRAVMLLFL